MLVVAAVALAGSCLLSAAAILSFTRSVATAKALLSSAIAAATVGGLLVGVGAAVGQRRDLLGFSFLLAGAAVGSDVNAARHLSTRPARWIHRFAIYAGYGGTFAGMAAGGVWLDSRGASALVAAAVFFGAYITGSVCIFAAKTLTVRFAAKTMPEYAASVIDDTAGQSYW